MVVSAHYKSLLLLLLLFLQDTGLIYKFIAMQGIYHNMHVI